jgi:hypothetical protein
MARSKFYQESLSLKSIHTRHLFHKASILIGSHKGEAIPPCSEIANQAWEQTASKALFYYPQKDIFLPNWDNQGIVSKTGLNTGIEEMKMYVQTIPELPRLVLSDCGIGCTEKVDKELYVEYLDFRQWMEFFLLHNSDALLEMSSICREYYGIKAEVWSSLYRLIQDIWSKNHSFCQWAKAFSPSQLWFCCLIEFCFNNLQNQQILPGREFESIPEYNEEDRAMVRKMQSPKDGNFHIDMPEQISKGLVSPYIALLLTADRLAQENIFYAKAKRKPSPYQQFTKAFLKSSNFTRKTNRFTTRILSSNRQQLVSVNSRSQANKIAAQRNC